MRVRCRGMGRRPVGRGQDRAEDWLEQGGEDAGADGRPGGEKQPPLARLSTRLLTRMCCPSGWFRSRGGNYSSVSRLRRHNIRICRHLWMLHGRAAYRSRFSRQQKTYYTSPSHRGPNTTTVHTGDVSQYTFLDVLDACLAKVRQAVVDAKQELQQSNSTPGGSTGRGNGDDGIGLSGLLSLVRVDACCESLELSSRNILGTFWKHSPSVRTPYVVECRRYISYTTGIGHRDGARSSTHASRQSRAQCEQMAAFSAPETSNTRDSCIRCTRP